MSNYPNQYPQVGNPNQQNQQAQQYPQQPYYAPPQGAYPPQQGAYPPQQQAGYPPQQQQYPPQGYYPPQQGYYAGNNVGGYVPLTAGTVVVALNPVQLIEARIRRLTISLAITAFLFSCVFGGMSLASPTSSLYWGDFFTVGTSQSSDIYFGLKKVTVCGNINSQCVSADIPEPANSSLTGAGCYDAGRRSYSMNVAAIVFAVVSLFALCVFMKRPRLGAVLVLFFTFLSSILLLCSAVTWGKDCFSDYIDLANNSSYTTASYGVQYIFVLIGGIGGLVQCVITGLFLLCYGLANSNATLSQPLVA